MCLRNCKEQRRCNRAEHAESDLERLLERGHSQVTTAGGARMNGDMPSEAFDLVAPCFRALLSGKCLELGDLGGSPLGTPWAEQ